jgi:O-methyltransferase involved in polyketide biosynthesis
VRAGLLLYLTAGEAGRLLTGVGELSAPGSQLSFEHDPAATATLAGQAWQMPACGRTRRCGRAGSARTRPNRWPPTGGSRRATASPPAAQLTGGRCPARGGFLTAVRTGR